MRDDASTRLTTDLSIDPLIAVRTDRARVGDEIDALYRLHRRRLVGLAGAVTFDRSAAEEIVQESFAGLARRLARPDEPVRDPVAYLQRSVVNLGIHHVRRRNRQRRLAEPPRTLATLPEVAELWPLVAALPVRQRAVVALRFWEDLRHEQIAVVLDIPLGTVKSTLHRALARLKEQL